LTELTQINNLQPPSSSLTFPDSQTVAYSLTSTSINRSFQTTYISSMAVDWRSGSALVSINKLTYIGPG